MKRSNTIEKIKKYLFYISIFFVVIILSHFTYLYLFVDSKKTPIEWWTITEWVVGNTFLLNPFLQNTDNEEYANSMLFRSLLNYDTKEQKLIGDLATCSLDNLARIECILRDNAKWSNWEKITSKDIIATYIKAKTTNKYLESILENTQIEETTNGVVFINNASDIIFVNALFQPIVASSDIEKMNLEELTGNFNNKKLLYSWRFKLDWTVESDNTLWVTKLNFIKNEYFVEDDEMFVTRYTFVFFKNVAELTKHINLVNVVNDNTIWNTNPRFEVNKYYLPRFSMVFLNSARLKDVEMRNYILNLLDREKIQEELKKRWINHKNIENPYLVDWLSVDKKFTKKDNKNIFASLWYYKKADLIEKLKKDMQSTTSSWIVNPLDEKSVYVKAPFNNKINFTSNNDFILEWNVGDKKPQAIYINDYKLNLYTEWNPTFTFKINEGIKTITPWKNTYKIVFEIAWVKEQVEEIVVYLNNNETLERIKWQYKLEFDTKVNESNKTTQISEEKLNKINSLSDDFYYNANLDILNLTMFNLWENADNIELAKIIKKHFYNNGIMLDVQSVTTKEILDEKAEKKYDILLTWIDLKNSLSNIYPYFKINWIYNFAASEKVSLETLLLELKTKLFTKEKTIELQKQVIEILKNEQLVKTIFVFSNDKLVDKSINGYNNIEWIIPLYRFTFNWFVKSFILSKHSINWESKNIFWFLKFLIKHEWVQ